MYLFIGSTVIGPLYMKMKMFLHPLTNFHPLGGDTVLRVYGLW